MTTPMMQQYHDAKSRHPGMLLLFRMGDFYELFDDDAELVSRLLGLTLTSRDKSIPMAGIPHHQLEKYLQKLLQLGHRVAICDQVEDPSAAKGLVRREVTRIVTPGTITEDEMLDPRRPNHLVVITWQRDTVGIAWADLSTGDFHAMDAPRDRLADELQRIQPAELILPDSLANEVPTEWQPLLPRTVTGRPDWTFDPETTRAALSNHFRVSTFSGYGFDHDNAMSLVAAGALLIYLQETLRSSLQHIRRLKPHRPDRVLLLDDVTRRSLELTRTLRDGSRDGSLLAMLDRSVTAMGARFLHEAILAPLTDRPQIEARLDAVEELLSEHSLRGELRDLMSGIADLYRLTGRVSTLRATPRDLASIARTLRLLPKFKAKLARCRSAILVHLEQRIDLCPDLREALDNALVDDPPINPKDGGVIRQGYHADLDQYRALAADGKGWIARFQAQEITRTGIPSLKVAFTQGQGYYIEITNTHQSKVPANYVRARTLKNAERYYTSELKEYEEKVLSADDKATALENELFLALREQVSIQTPRLLATADVIAMLDFLAALAELAASRQYVRPEMHDEPLLEIREGRHPVLDQSLPPGTFVPNDVILGRDVGYLWLITGPNMSGKSTFIRQIALITLMSHIGSFVPAQRARIGITDRIFTRVGASDELSRGQSTFMVEMTEAANILNNATGRSLIILDEIGRGTSTYDGVSLAWAIAEYLHDEVQGRALFATHYHELAQLASSLPGLRNYNVQVRELTDDVIFLHKIAEGSAAKSYGIHVARLAGVPMVVLQRAQSILGELESRHQLPQTLHVPEKPPRGMVQPPERRRPGKRQRNNGPNLFGAVDEIAGGSDNPHPE